MRLVGQRYKSFGLISIGKKTTIRYYFTVSDQMKQIVFKKISNRTRALDCQKCGQRSGKSRIQDFSVAIAERENRRIPRGA
jgi:hypothetical protein